MTFAIIARRYTTRAGVLPPTKGLAFRWWTLERVLLISCGLIAIGALGIGWCFVVWASSGFGPLDYPTLLRVLVFVTDGDRSRAATHVHGLPCGNDRNSDRAARQGPAERAGYLKTTSHGCEKGGGHRHRLRIGFVRRLETIPGVY